MPLLPFWIRGGAAKVKGCITVIEQALTRAVPKVDRRSWLRWGTGVFAAVEAFHLVAGTLINEWEGWGVFLGNLSFVVVSGALITALVFGLLVRWGLKPSPRRRNRAATASVAAALLSVAGYGIFFTWAHLLIAPAAVLLARAGLTGAEEGHGAVMWGARHGSRRGPPEAALAGRLWRSVARAQSSERRTSVRCFARNGHVPVADPP